MQITDTIADLLTRIRNASAAKHESVEIPASNMKKAICQILMDEGYIRSFTVTEDGKQGHHQGSAQVRRGQDPPSSRALRKVSKPGPAHLFPARPNCRKVMKGLGIAIISTSRGVMTDREARKQNLGGEVLAFHSGKQGGADKSRIGRKPINIPAGVTVTADANVVTVKGAQGHAGPRSFHPNMTISG